MRIQCRGTLSSKKMINDFSGHLGNRFLVPSVVVNFVDFPSLPGLEEVK